MSIKHYFVLHSSKISSIFAAEIRKDRPTDVRYKPIARDRSQTTVTTKHTQSEYMHCEHTQNENH